MIATQNPPLPKLQSASMERLDWCQERIIEGMSSTAPVGYGGVSVLLVQHGETEKQELFADNLAIGVAQVKCELKSNNNL